MIREFHPIANIFPMMTPAEHERLKESIEKHGLQEPILIYEDKILDGRNRYKACQELGIHCLQDDYESMHDLDPVDFVMAVNRDRRHLTPSQLSAVGHKLRELYDTEAKERYDENVGRPSKKESVENLPPISKGSGKARDKAGAAVGVSGKSIDFAGKVAKKGTPALNAALESGKIAVSKAAKIADLPPAEQDKIVSGEAEFKPPRSTPKKAEVEPVVEGDEPIETSKFSEFRDNLGKLISGLTDMRPCDWYGAGDMLSDASQLLKEESEKAYKKATQ